MKRDERKCHFPNGEVKNREGWCYSCKYYDCWNGDFCFQGKTRTCLDGESNRACGDWKKGGKR